MFDGWDVALLLIACYVAVVALVRLMLHHRDVLTKRFRKELNAEQRRRAQEEAGHRHRERQQEQDVA
jgi:hypothetical protein